MELETWWCISYMMNFSYIQNCIQHGMKTQYKWNIYWLVFQELIESYSFCDKNFAFG